MQIPPDWSRPRKQIALAYLRHIAYLKPHQSIIKIIGAELGYKKDPHTGSYPFVALVIRQLEGQH